MTDERLEFTKIIHAPAGRIFALLCSPAGHAQIDGSGMLVGPQSTEPVGAVGDRFRMDMDRRPLNDVPGMTDYTVTVVITGYESDRLIEWSVEDPAGEIVNHLYGYRLAPLDDGTTEVTAYYDWSAISEERKQRRPWPVVPAESVASSLDRLAGVVEASDR